MTAADGDPGRAFCATLSVRAGEPLAGTAPTRRAWLLVEHPGPWGREPLTDAPWPDGLGAALEQATTATGVRMVAARRHDARPLDGPPARPFVALSFTGEDGAGWAVSRCLDDARQLRDLPLADLAAGRRPGPGDGWAPAGPLWGVCTQGTRDACCARLGRQIAEDLAARDPEHVWEISHSGGHRFAPVLMAWPEGLAYGRVPAERLDELVDARRRGHVVPDLLRGRVHQSEPLQAGELAVRLHVGVTALDGVRPATPPAGRGRNDGTQADDGTPAGTSDDGTSDDGTPAGTSDDGGAGDHAVRGDGPVPTWWRADGRTWRVNVRRTVLPDRPASCGKAPEPASAWICDDPVPSPGPR